MFLKLKDLFEKVNFETSLAAVNNKSMNNYSTCKELILALIVGNPLPLDLCDFRRAALRAKSLL